MAIELVTLTTAPVPTAVELSPLAIPFAPRITELAALACASNPIAMAFFPPASAPLVVLEFGPSLPPMAIAPG